MNVNKKILIRKANSFLKKILFKDNINRDKVIQSMSYNEGLMKEEEEFIQRPLPTFGKLKMVIEKDLKEELNRYQNDYNKSDTDLKRLALKSAFLDYYNELDYDPETTIVDYYGDMTLKRDNVEEDNTDFNFAPNKNKIYQIWMGKLERYVRDNKLSESELDEAAFRGIPQGGAFEKQLDRYRKEIMQQLWQDFYKQRNG
jgi:hypothetical protein